MGFVGSVNLVAWTVEREGVVTTLQLYYTTA